MNGTTTISAGRSLVLATDLDGTFAGGTADDRARLQRTLTELPNSTLIYVTGRSVAATRELMDELGLPVPDLLIADVGTTVARGSDFEPVREIEEELGRDWPGADAIRERLDGMPAVVEQEIRVPRRVSYWLVEGPMARAIERAGHRLDEFSVDFVGSADTYLDVLPAGVNKGTTLRRVLSWLGRDDDDAVVAGDTLNDLALFEAGYRGVVVGNCEPALRHRVGAAPNVYLAEGYGAAGILEGLVHFGWLEGGTDGE